MNCINCKFSEEVTLGDGYSYHECHIVLPISKSNPEVIYFPDTDGCDLGQPKYVKK